MVAIPPSSPYYNAILYGGGAGSTQSQSAQQATNVSQSGSYIPSYSETPILENIANYSAAMAPQVYQWGMDQYSRNQGNIDALMRNALCMTKEEKVAELKAYFDGSGCQLDVDRIMADQAAVGAAESAWDYALLKIAVAAGVMLGREPVTAQELAEAMKGRDTRAWIGLRSLRRKT